MAGGHTRLDTDDEAGGYTRWLTRGKETNGRFEIKEDTLGCGRHASVGKVKRAFAGDRQGGDVATVPGVGGNLQANVEDPVLACLRLVIVN